jgi:N4-gp56 family major capsid protein
MPLGTNHVTTTTADKFIPELWSDEIFSTYKANLVFAPNISYLNHVGRKGDTVHVPTPIRGTTSSKTQGSQVTLQASTELENSFTIAQWFEYSRAIEDIVDVQALDSLRQFYTNDAGYALAKRVDTTIHTKAADLNRTSTAYDGAVIGSDGSTTWSGTANTNTGNGARITDTGLRRVLQTLDDSDVPGRDRFLIIPPVEKNSILGIPRFTEQAFVGEMGSGNAIRTGRIGELYGVPVYVTSNCATITAADTTTQYRACILGHKDSLVLIEQLKPRVQSQYKLEYLADLLVADTLFDVGRIRRTSSATSDSGRVIVVPV